jgi:hypothetical protein
MSLLPLGLLSQGGVAAPSSFELISTTTLGSSTASVTFSSIASTYSHLQIRAAARSDRNFGVDNIGLRFNSDSGSNYNTHFLFNNGSTITSTDLGINSWIYSARLPDAAVTASSFGAAIIDVLDYKATTKNKTIRSIFGSSTTGSYPWNGMHSGVWLSTTAITSLTLLPVTGPNFITGSRFSLYGIKGA